MCNLFPLRQYHNGIIYNHPRLRFCISSMEIIGLPQRPTVLDPTIANSLGLRIRHHSIQSSCALVCSGTSLGNACNKRALESDTVANLHARRCYVGVCAHLPPSANKSTIRKTSVESVDGSPVGQEYLQPMQVTLVIVKAGWR